MKITTHTTWTIAKGDQAMELTLEDIEHLLSQVALGDNLMVFDEESRRCGTGDDTGISLNGNAVQITLFKEERK